MRAGIYRSVSMLLTAVFLLSSLITGTLGWQSLGQTAKNEAQSEILRQVELLKLEKLPDGTETEIPVPGAAFYLFAEDGAQIGGRYVTDENGTIPVSLKPGEYYFEESSPVPGFAFDTDEKGQQLTRYPFVVTGNETETVVVTVYNIRLQGALTIAKDRSEMRTIRPLRTSRKRRNLSLPSLFPAAVPIRILSTEASRRSLLAAAPSLSSTGKAPYLSKSRWG